MEVSPDGFIHLEMGAVMFCIALVAPSFFLLQVQCIRPKQVSADADYQVTQKQICFHTYHNTWAYLVLFDLTENGFVLAPSAALVTKSKSQH